MHCQVIVLFIQSFICSFVRQCIAIVELILKKKKKKPKRKHYDYAAFCYSLLFILHHYITQAYFFSIFFCVVFTTGDKIQCMYLWCDISCSFSIHPLLQRERTCYAGQNWRGREQSRGQPQRDPQRQEQSEQLRNTGR